jgi:hypothetical protein
MHGFPPMTAGLRVIRAKSSMVVTVPERNEIAKPAFCGLSMEHSGDASKQ